MTAHIRCWIKQCMKMNGIKSSDASQIKKSGFYFEGHEPPLKVLSMKDMIKAILNEILMS